MADSHPKPTHGGPIRKHTRRSERIALAVPVQLRGTDSQGRPFDEKTKTQVISPYGVLLISPRPLLPRQEIAIRCIATGKETAARVVEEVEVRAEDYLYGVEFANPDSDLWGIRFPPATESERAAARVVLECSRCHAFEVTLLSVGELEVFHNNRRLSRFCARCNGPTTWNEANLSRLLVESDSSLTPRPPGEQAPAGSQRSADERANPRVSLTVRGCIRTDEHGEEIVQTENVSDGGASFSSRRKYVEGSIVDVAIPYIQGGANVFVQARILWSKYDAAEYVTTYGLAYFQAARRARRSALKTKVDIGFIGAGHRSVGTIADLSARGVLVRCEEKFEPGDIVRMGIEMGHETIRLVAIARRAVPGIGTGFEFMSMGRNDRMLLTRLLLRIQMESRS